MPTPGDPNHKSGYAHEIMTKGNGRNTEKYHGKRCTILRAVIEDDDAFDKNIGQTLVKTVDGATIALHNHEVCG